MTPTPHLRKQPRQERSRAMVERVLDAARTVLAEQGYERLTTNAVARTAGISPGSLYQYFPDKGAILAAVVDRYAADVDEELTAMFTRCLQAPPDRLVHDSVAGLLDILTTHREFVRLVTRELPATRVSTHLGTVERRISDLMLTHLAVSRPTERVEPEVSAWLCVRLVEHLCVQFVLDPPRFGREVLIAELTHLLSAHLAPETANDAT